MKSFIFFLCIITTRPCLSFAKNFTVEIESIPVKRDAILRTNASGKRSTVFKTGDKLFVNFCLRKSSTVRLLNIRFSNDGDADIVFITIDRQRLGSFMSKSNSNRGFNWNVFSVSGQIGPELTLSPGRHVYEMTFVTDFYGIELDTLMLQVGDNTLEEDLLRCMPVCNTDINYSTINHKDDIPSAKLVQASYPTFCAKDRNINYQLFHKSVSQYRITAAPPKYRTLLNGDTTENFACEAESNVIWEFKNFNILRSEASKTMGNASLTFGGTSLNRQITVSFHLARDISFSRMQDEDVGAILTLNLKDPAPSYTAKLTHSSRNGDQMDVQPTSTSGGSVKWDIPDFTWIENAQNNVEVTLVVENDETVLGEFFKLERRPKLADNKTVIYEDKNTKIEVLTEDQWWRSPLGMDVSGQSAIFRNITKIIVYKMNRFTNGFNEIFQINQDGVTSIKPMVLHGAQSVPYSSSFVVGQFNHSDKRPYAGISTVVVDPFSLIFYIGYINTNVATLKIKSESVNTEIRVKNATFVNDRNRFPIAGIRSTWVSDGNADIDRVSANRNVPRPLIDDWDVLYGTSFAFFRQCVSLHNTQGPDLILELMNSHDSGAV